MDGLHALYGQVRGALVAARDGGRITPAQAARALTELGQGQPPTWLPADPADADALVRLAWLIFVRAPSLDGRYVALGPMNLAFLASGMRTLVEIVDELSKLEQVSGDGGAALEAVLQARGPALQQLVLNRHAVDMTGQRLAAQAEQAEQRTQTAADDGRWEDVAVDGPDAEAIRTALRRMPADTAKAVFAAWTEASAAQEEERWADALAACDRAAALAPELFEVWVRRARVRFGSGDRAGAGADVERAISLNPAATAARAMRAELRMIIRDARGSLEDWDAAVASAPHHAPYRMGRAYTRMAMGRIDEAVQDFDQAVACSPGDKVPLFARAEMKVRRKDLGGAVQDYSRILAIDETDAQARLNRGTAELMQRHGQEAHADLTWVIERQPADPTAWGRRSAANLNLGRPWAAWLDAMTALALAPDDWGQTDQTEQFLNAAYQHLGGQERGSPEELRARIDLLQRKTSGREVVRLAEALETHIPGEGLEWHLIRGETFIVYGRWAQAERAWRDALAVDPQSAAAWLGLGRSLLARGDHPAALDALDKALGLAWGLDGAATFELHLARGRTFGSLGRLPEALAAFDEALALRPDRGDVWFYRGVHASLDGDGEAAERAYTASIERQPAFAAAWFNRACERSRLGRTDEALQDLERAATLEVRWAADAETDEFLVAVRELPAFEAFRARFAAPS